MLNISEQTDNRSVEQKSILFKTLKTPNAGKLLAKVLVSISLVFFVLLFFPWQQNIRGKGKVTAFSPGQRPQSVESAIAGRIEAWHVIEGQFVEKGDTILTLSEVKDDYFDPQLLQRTQEQIEAKRQSIDSKKEKITQLENQIEALQNLMKVKLEQAQNKLRQSRFKLTSDSVDYEAEKVRYANQENIFYRNKQRYEAGNIALTKFQELESKYQEAKMKLISAENKFLESKTEVINARVNITGVEAEYQDKISKARSDLNNTAAEVFEAEADLAKLENQFSNYQIRTQNYQLRAPQSGYVVKALKAGVGETIKEGESIVQIISENPRLAVEMYVKAMDVPLIQKGRKVRIEFDGWPALQFSGWPSVSVGTFGGVVQVIDRVESRPGEFRILVTPDPAEEEWPQQLRMGSGTKGWVMLDNVPVWYEIWRQLNGFPPSLYEAPEDAVLVKEEKK
ncbi:HlyD family efflux transporter periplasmic adaptor subunit [Roseivirga sp. UBA1976]|uniref:HlyD family secretion protein n=1 Tax=Roseivirga sp. UBA1976 TaxID=1947386 RepID=UPI0025806847|nr:HlyD family efflux transporter periplasmic adaptor subunit [Roseivirga sp. UBA1976]MEC7754058.1 HlyD family efflux transporter periplasmic adaptor subunit [Bacteroidota bacterium]|tara:strand:- start:10038 stop:11393 length:1356 start_codon:yes stop_codon:yes gene_type:complete